jgi:hydrogenase maturation protein HypF
MLSVIASSCMGGTEFAFRVAPALPMHLPFSPPRSSLQTSNDPSDPRSRRAIRVRGTVQGVGFRPVVYRIARAAGLVGFVRNDGEGVWIEIEGGDVAVAAFVAALRRESPPLARIDAIEIAPLPLVGDLDFRVVASAPTARTGATIPADAATCDACLRELLDPNDRRYRYPFINCTDCGPRFTIIRDVPYDRARTTMASFVMCAQCRAEYEDPANRRFHAEPNACAECGPRIALVERERPRKEGEAALRRATDLIAAGSIVALKGLGGYQLAVRADLDDAVWRLRALKRRPHKPFALMVRDVETAARVAELTEEERAALLSWARPIVLLAAKAGRHVTGSIAPYVGELGIMLPSTPLHHLLLADTEMLVMTSGNVADEPIAKDDDDAIIKLDGIADAFLVHDRAIHTRADDSVVRVTSGRVQPVRRARGYVPAAVGLPFDAPPVLSVGGALKSTVCLVRGREAYLSQHIGDLDGVDARAFFVEVIAKLSQLLQVEPVLIAHDFHPDYVSTRWALAQGLPCVAVQHHHAHIASCLAEHGRTDEVIGVAFDGTGCGPRGDLWGGEFLLCDLAQSKRLGHLRPITLAGGESAIREPWRLALAALIDAGEPLDLLAHVPERRQRFLARMIEREISAPKATGAGRWFDAVASLVGVRDTVSYEAQAAIELEALARGSFDDRAYPFVVDAHAGSSSRAPFVVEMRPTIRAVAADVRADVPGARIAARFYATMAELIAESCRHIRRHQGIDTVALSGGCFQSVMLTERTKARLERDGFEVLVHRLVPANDGGLALGQAAVAAYRAVVAPEGGTSHVSRHTG